MGTLPNFAATLPLPHPCPSSSPFSIGHDGFFRLHRLEPSRPRDARRSIRCAPNAGAILARADISLYSCFYRRYRLSEPLSTKSLIPRTYPVSNPISITYARTCDVFFMHAMPPSGLGQRGSVRHSKICAANSQHTPLGANRVSWALIAVNHEPRYTAATAADSGVSYVARTMAAYPPRGPVRGRLHGKSMGVGANRGRVCPCVGACDGLHSTAGGCCRWSIEGLGRAL